MSEKTKEEMGEEKITFQKFPKLAWGEGEFKGLTVNFGDMNEIYKAIHDCEAWREDTVAKLEKVKVQLNEILDSELMKQARKFMPRTRDRWEGQLSVVEELLESLNPVDNKESIV